MDSKQFMNRINCRVKAHIPKELIQNLAHQYIKNGWSMKQFQINLGVSFNQASYAFSKARKELKNGL